MIIRNLFVIFAVLIGSVTAAGAAVDTCRNPLQGDTCTFLGYSYRTGGPQDIEIEATCRAVGDHVYLFVADDIWAAQMGVPRVQEVLDAYENGKGDWSPIQEGLEDITGFVPDVHDDDPKVYLLLHEIENLQDGAVVSYFRPEDVSENSLGQPPANSNKKEVIFMDTKSLYSTGGVLSDKHMSALAQSLCEMTGYVADPEEESWVVDSICRAAAHLLGFSTPQEDVAHFAGNSTFPLFGNDAGDLDHGATVLFGLYLWDHFNEGGGSLILNYWLQDAAEGIEGFQNTLSLIVLDDPSFATQMHNWALYNYIRKGMYQYESISVPGFTYPNIRNHPKRYLLPVPASGANAIKVLSDALPLGETVYVDISVAEPAGLTASYVIDDGTNTNNPQPIPLDIQGNSGELRLTLENAREDWQTATIVFSYAVPSGEQLVVTVETSVPQTNPGDEDTTGDEDTVDPADEDETSPNGGDDDIAEEGNDHTVTPSGNYSCLDIAVCTRQCLQNICFERCREEGTLNAQEEWDIYNSCIAGENPTNTNCIEITNSTDRAYCIYKNCFEWAELCEPDPAPDGIDGEKTGSSSCGTTSASGVIWLILPLLVFGVLMRRSSNENRKKI